MNLLNKQTNEQPETESKLSLQDIRLKKYLELDAQIKQLNKELSVLKDEFKHAGSFSTRNYVCTVSEQTRKSAPGLGELIKLYGPSVEQHCKETTYRIIKVSQKGEV